ncbi:MAG: GntR family transcriptional regulator [Acidobacteria bacterium]|nr:GntR family transcriptional regulator [Acidobacteriota bacterium]
MSPKEGAAKGKATQTERTYHIIKHAVLRGEIQEGQFLSEKEFMDKYKIGRTPFREACNRLHNDKILEVVPHRGYFVPELTFRGFGDMFEVRFLIEGAIAEIAALRATPEQVAELDLIADSFSPANSSPLDTDQVISLNKEFHLCLARMTQNNELVDLQRRILERTERLMYIECRRSGHPIPLFSELHKAVVDAIRKGDASAARTAVRQDITQSQIRSTVFRLPNEERDSESANRPAAHASAAGVVKKPRKERKI